MNGRDLNDALAPRAAKRGEHPHFSPNARCGLAGPPRQCCSTNIEKRFSPLYNCRRDALPDLPSNPAPPPKPRRWTVFPAAFLLLALAVVVIYTSRSALLSPVALVVVAAIGLAALLLQLRLRKDIGKPVHAPLWLNIFGLIFALAAMFADKFRLNSNGMQMAALGAVFCFAISGMIVLHQLRRK